jgi:drug/metabolite transporter (DMT)-like permease
VATGEAARPVPARERAASPGSPLATYLLVFAAVTFWSLTGIVFAIVLDNATISPLTVVLLRGLTAAAILGLYLALARRDGLRVARRHLPQLALLGFVYITIFYPALIYTYELNSVPVGTALLYLFPAFVTLVSTRWFGEALTRRKLLALALCLLGTFVVVAPWRDGEFSPLGVLLGVVSAATYAYYAAFSRPLLQHYHFTTVLFYTLGIGCLGLLPLQVFATPAGSPPAFVGLPALPDPWTTLRIALILGVLITLLPLSLYTVALGRLPAGNVAIAATIEPALTIIFAALILGQYLAAVQLLGAALVVAGVIVLASGGA